MKIQCLKEELLNGLAPFASQNGFKIIKKSFELSKKTPNGDAKISFLHTFGVEDIKLQPFVEIRFRTIHELCSQHGFHLNYTAFINLFVLEFVLKNKFDENTQWKLALKGNDRFSIHSAKDIVETMDALKPMLSHALSYIDNYSTMDSISRLYNSKPEDEYNPNCSGMDTHCFVGLIASKLSNDNYETIRKIYSDIVTKKDFQESTKQSFYSIRDYLDGV